jgi:regulator of RNase E activity RraA
MDSLIDLARSHGTSAVSDALDRLGGGGGLPGLRRVSGSGAVAGPAFTVRMRPVREGTRAPAADYIDDVPPGAVVVLAVGGADHATVWGDILTAVAQARGVAATVIDGACRDADTIRDTGYPLWARSTYMKSGKNRIALDAVEVPVTIGGTRVEPGDIVCADGSGVVVVPHRLAGGVAEGARAVAAMEARVLEDVRAGRPLREARARHGYHEAALPTGLPPGLPRCVEGCAHIREKPSTQ